MNLQLAPEPFDILVVNDAFSDEELSMIWKELDFITNDRTLFPPELTGSAKDGNGHMMKKNKATFLPNIYQKQEYSLINTVLGKFMKNEEIISEMVSMNKMHHLYSKINSTAVLVSYYEDSDYYEPHQDSCAYTILSYVFREPKSFSGGDISFYYGEAVMTVKIENNLSIIFPSYYDHSVSEVVMNEQNPLDGTGRYCLSQFCWIVP